MYKEKLDVGERVGENDPLNGGENDTLNVGENDPLNVRQIEVLNLIKQNKKITKEEVAIITKFSIETTKRDFNILIKNNYIKRIGSKKGGFWEVIK